MVQQNIMYLLVLIVCIQSVFFAIMYRKQKKTNLDKMSDMKLRLLTAQFNPHFISNSLNAIDSLINKNKNADASEYIVNFSRFCRLVLNNTDKRLIGLNKELETIRYFLSIEQLRMRNKFTYSVEVDKNLDQHDVLVPPMFLQPFVENALIHGIQHKTSNGHIVILIRQYSKGVLQCRIEDDGVGRIHAHKLQSDYLRNHKSRGIDITMSRIEAISPLNTPKIEIIDLIHEDGKAKGTQVNILLPVIQNIK